MPLLCATSEPFSAALQPQQRCTNWAIGTSLKTQCTQHLNAAMASTLTHLTGTNVASHAPVFCPSFVPWPLSHHWVTRYNSWANAPDLWCTVHACTHTRTPTDNTSPSTHAHAADNDSMHVCTYAHKSRIVIEARTQGDDDVAYMISVMYQVNKVFLK